MSTNLKAPTPEQLAELSPTLRARAERLTQRRLDRAQREAPGTSPAQAANGAAGGLKGAPVHIIIVPVAEKNNCEKGGNKEGTGVKKLYEKAEIDRRVNNPRVLEVLVGEEGEDERGNDVRVKMRMFVKEVDKVKFGVGREVRVEVLGGGLCRLVGKYNRWGVYCEGSAEEEMRECGE